MGQGMWSKIKDRQPLIACIMQWWWRIGSDILWLNFHLLSCKLYFNATFHEYPMIKFILK